MQLSHWSIWFLSNMSQTIDFFFYPMSHPARAVWMVLEELGLNYNENVIDLLNGEQKTDEFKKISPRQKVPAIKVGDFCVAESRAAAQYLVNKFGKQQGKQSLYPGDPEKRAKVDQHLYIGENTVEEIMKYVNAGGVFFRGEDTNEDNLPIAKEALKFIEGLLSENEYTVGDKFTLADIFYYIAVGFMDVTDFNDWDEYPKLVAWRKKIAAKPYHKKTWEDPLVQMTQMYQSLGAKGPQIN